MLRECQLPAQSLLSRSTHLLWNLPQALQSAVHVAAPQHDAATDQMVATLGNASNGRDNSVPIVATYCMLLVPRREDVVGILW